MSRVTYFLKRVSYRCFFFCRFYIVSMLGGFYPANITLRGLQIAQGRTNRNGGSVSGTKRGRPLVIGRLYCAWSATTAREADGSERLSG